MSDRPTDELVAEYAEAIYATHLEGVFAAEVVKLREDADTVRQYINLPDDRQLVRIVALEQQLEAAKKAFDATLTKQEPSDE